MKIKHNIKLQEDGLTLKGQILETIFEEGEYRGEREKYYSEDREFYIKSIRVPLLRSGFLLVWGEDLMDSDIVSYKYKSTEEAKKILDYINEFTVEEVFTEEEATIEDFREEAEECQPNKVEIVYESDSNMEDGFTYIKDTDKNETVEEWQPKEGEMVYVSDESVECALEYNHKRIYLGTFNGIHLYVSDLFKEEYRKGEPFETFCIKYIAQIPSITLEEAEKQLGCKIISNK